MLFILFFIFIFRVGSSIQHKSESISKNNEVNQSNMKINKSWENVVWLIGNNQIVFQYKKNPNPQYQSDSSTITTIRAEDQPHLFERLDYNVIKVLPFTVGNKTFYLLANVFYQAAGYTLHYATIVDIDSNKALYRTNDMIDSGEFSNIQVLENGDIKVSTVYGHYDFCRSCGYYLNEYLGYKEGIGYVTKNANYKTEFIKLQSDINRNNHCAVINGGKQMTFEEVSQQYGENYQCRSSSSTPVMTGSSPKEYFNLKNKVDRIVKGEEVSLLDNNL